MFHSFSTLAFELRRKVYCLMLTPRYVHYNSTLTLQSDLVLETAVPVLLHICHESREFALQQYKLYTLGPRQLYLHPILDIFLWIRYPVGFGPQAFHDDAQRLLQETENTPLEMPKLAISVMFWNRIKAKEGMYRDLYERIRNGRIQRLCIVNDVYLPITRTRVTGAALKLKKWNTGFIGLEKVAWGHWDAQTRYWLTNKKREEILPDIKFRKVAFV